MKSSQIYFFILIVFCLGHFSCRDVEPEMSTPPEFITTLIYTLTPVNGGDPVILTYRDLDGDGGDAPIVTSGALAANLRYSGSVRLLDESVLPAIDVTLEIDEEGDDHQFFFSSNITGLSVSYADTDDNGNRFGLLSNLTTNNAGNGTLMVTLIHEPEKFAASVSNGDVTNAGGQIDIEAKFDIVVQ